MCSYAKRFDCIKILFLIAGHTKNAQDQLNSHVAHRYSKGEFFSLDQLSQDLTDPKRKFSTQCRVMDWGEKFDPLICRYPQIFKAHVFELTNQGMRTKEFADDPRWNAWNNVEDDVYHAMLQECPCGLVQPMKPYALSEAKKQDLEKSLSYVPVKEREYLMSMLHGAVGFDLMAAECFKDFNSNVPSTAQPVSVPLHFRTKAKHANVVPPQPNAKKTCSDARVSSSEIRDLLATQEYEDQPL